MSAETARHYEGITPGQCSPAVHHFYSSEDEARAAARAKSHNGMFYTHRKCPACTGWRLTRVS